MILNWFKSLRLQTRFLTLFGIFIVLGAISTTAFLSIINTMNTSTLVLIDESRDLVQVGQLQSLLLEERRFAEEYAISGDNEAFFGYAGTRENVRLTLDALLSDTSDQELLDLLNPIDELVTANHAALSEVIELHIDGEFDAAQEIAQNTIQERAEVYLEIDRQLDSYITFNILFFDSMILFSLSQIQTAVGIAAVVLFFFFVLGVLASVVTNDVIEPILYLINAIHSFESSTYNSELLKSHMNRADEIGVLVRTFDDTVHTITDSIARTAGLLTATTRFVPNNYLDFLNKRSIEDLELGDHISANMAVMFSDIRGFTTLSEAMTPQENFDFVNDYLQRVSPIIQKHNGFVVKFLGDGMMAIFPYAVRDSLIAALEKLQAVHDFNTEREKNGKAPINLGIGIHIGSMMIGMVGEAQRMQGDAFSDNVNLTSRLEGLNKVFGTNIIISGDAIQMLPRPNQFEMRSLGLVIVKGRSTPLQLYDVYEADPTDQRALKHNTRELFNEGLVAYQQGDLNLAKAKFSDVIQRNQKDRAAQFYIDEISKHTTPDANWTGVVVMTSK